MTIRLASLDMAGTTIDEGGAVYAVLRDAVQRSTGREVPDDLLSRWSGTDKREAIAGILTAIGEDVRGTERIFGAFSTDLAAAYAETPPALLPGVGEAVSRMRSDGIAVALQTGYVREVAEGLLDAVGWRVGRDVDALVTAEDVTASRPAPYLIFRTMEATGTVDVHEVLVAGDTVNDVLAGTRSGARFVVGVLTGAHSADEFGSAPRTHLLPGVADVPELLAARA